MSWLIVGLIFWYLLCGVTIWVRIRDSVPTGFVRTVFFIHVVLLWLPTLMFVSLRLLVLGK